MMLKTLKYYMMGVLTAVALPLVTACSDDEEVDPYDLNYVYIYSPNPSDNNLEYKANGTFITSIEEQCVVNPVRCTKPAPTELTVTLDIDASLVERYNADHGTSYTLLKAAKLENSTLVIKEGAYTSEQSLRVSYTDMSEFRNGAENYILPIAITSVKGSGVTVSQTTGHIFLTFTSLYRENHVSLTKEIYNQMVLFKSSGFTTDLERIELSDALLTEWAADARISVKLAIDNSQVDIINVTYGVNYEPLPVEVKLSPATYTIAPGASQPEQVVALELPDGLASMPLEEKSYLIPIAIEEVDGEGAAVNSESRFCYVTLDCVEQPFASYVRKATGTPLTLGDNWTVTVDGAEYLYYEGWGEYWWYWLFEGYEVDYWYAGSPMVVDLGEEQTLSCISIYSSYGTSWCFKSMKVETSTDGWHYEGGDCTLQKSATQTIQINEPTPVRYLRLTPIDAYGNYYGVCGYPTSITLYTAD